MRVVKHTRGLFTKYSQSNVLYYATIYTPALSPQFHPVGRPFAACLECTARATFPHFTLDRQRMS